MRPIQLRNLNISVPVFLAPMAGVTDLPFRSMVQKFGNILTCSEMISSEAVIRKNQRTIKMIPQSINGIKYVQIFGANPESMASAAKFAEEYGADMIDINMGCPVKKVVNTFAGSALMRDISLASSIIKSVRSATTLPVTLKMRLGWDHNHKNCIEIATMAESEGIDMLTIHGRTRSDLYSGKADWNFIGLVKKSVRIPVICNGDIVSLETAESALKASSADGIMIGRASLGSPWVPSAIAKSLAEKHYLDNSSYTSIDAISNEQKIDIIIEHLKSTIEHHGSETGISIFKKHACWYLKNTKNSSETKAQLNRSKSYEGMKDLFRSVFL